ncbi:MAG: branched-chain amino acid ABC transporter permease [Thermodesulfobacteriota bacterium]
MGAERMWDLVIMATVRGGLYSLMAVGLSLGLGVANISNFAHGEFYMLGAYFAYFGYTILHLGPLGGLVGAALGGLIVGVLVEKGLLSPLRNRSGADWIMNTFLLTLGLSIILQNSAKLFWGARYRGVTQLWAGSVRLLSTMEIPVDRVLSSVIAFGAIGGFWLFLTRTQPGRAVRAVAQDQTGAMLVGIDLKRIYMITFAASCALAALAGGSLISLTPAYPTVGLTPLYKSWFVLILIGMGTVGGCVVGGLVVAVLETVSYYFLGAGWQDAVSLSLIVLILLLKPTGIFGKAVRTVWEN